MKKIFSASIMTAILAVAIQGCHPADYKSVGTPQQIIPTLTGTWKLTKVTQTDEEAARKGFPFQTIDLTSVFPYNDTKLTLTATGNTPGTFTAESGNAPKIINATSGNWAVDDPANPKVITLANATDTSRITLGSYPIGGNPVLKVSLQKRDAVSNKLLISYSYEFTKQ